MGDLNEVSLKEIKRAMKFDLTCLLYASKLSFAYYLHEVKEQAGVRNYTTFRTWMTEHI
jgi:hypothetical protein